MFAAVDLGSNSFRLHVGRLEGGAFRIVKTARDPVRLGAGLDSKGNLTEQARQKALDCLRNFRTILDAYRLDAVRVVATNTLRIARNAAEFLPAAEQAIGYPIEIISGEEEGRLIYMGVASKLASPGEARLVIDIGGGSTELILGQGQEIRHVESFSIGTVPQSQTFFPEGRIDAAAFDAAILSARSVFEDAAPFYDRQNWTGAYGSSGTIRAISDGIAKNGIGDGTMSIASLLALKQHLIACGHVSRVQLAGVKPEEFNFKEKPGRGGALPSGGSEHVARDLSMAEFQAALDTLVKDVEFRDDYLNVVETTLMSDKIRTKLLPTIQPVNVSYNASGFGWRLDPFTGRNAFHEGIDFASPSGTPIVAAAGGVVIAAEYHHEYGNMLEIDHGNDIVTRYAHASKLYAKVGDIVRRGQHVADIGSTGRSTGAHLHFEVLVKGVQQNPHKFLSAGASQASGAALAATR